MEKWIDLLISMNFTECFEADQLLFPEKLETKIISTFIVNSDRPNEPFKPVGCVKLQILEKDYEKGLKIISENGYKSNIAFIDDSGIESSVPFPVQN